MHMSDKLYLFDIMIMLIAREDRLLSDAGHKYWGPVRSFWLFRTVKSSDIRFGVYE